MKFCKKCQAETERYANGRCKPCQKAQGVAYRAANSEKLKLSKKIYQAANKEKTKEYKKRYVANNKEKLRAIWKEYASANKASIAIYQASYRDEHRQKAKETTKKWRQDNPEMAQASCLKWYAQNAEQARASAAKRKAANPDAYRIYKSNRRARMLGAGGKLPKDLAKRLFELQKGKCPCCKLPLGDNFHLDHIMPIALGGTNTANNIQLLRAVCNNQKHAKHPVNFMQSRGFLL